MDTSNGMHTCVSYLDKTHTYVRYVQGTSSAALRAQHLSAFVAVRFVAALSVAGLHCTGWMASSSSGLHTSQHRWERRTDILNQLGSVDLDPWEQTLPQRPNSADGSDDDRFDDADAPNLYDTDDEGDANPDNCSPSQCSGEFLELLKDTFMDVACLTAKTGFLLCF